MCIFHRFRRSNVEKTLEKPREHLVQEAKEGLSMNQNDAMAHNNLGDAYKDQGKLDDAIRQYKLKQISFDISDNWADHKDLQVKIPWKTTDTNNSPIIDEAPQSPNPFMDNSHRPLIFEATVNDQLWVIRLNNFPDYPCFTLMIAQDQIMHEIIHFNDWPTFWGKRPDLPKLKRSDLPKH